MAIQGKQLDHMTGERILAQVPGAVKVEMIYSRGTGQLRVSIVSFECSEDRQRAEQWLAEGHMGQAVGRQAYSRKCKPNIQWVIQTFYRMASAG